MKTKKIANSIEHGGYDNPAIRFINTAGNTIQAVADFGEKYDVDELLPIAQALCGGCSVFDFCQSRFEIHRDTLFVTGKKVEKIDCRLRTGAIPLIESSAQTNP